MMIHWLRLNTKAHILPTPATAVRNSALASCGQGVVKAVAALLGWKTGIGKRFGMRCNERQRRPATGRRLVSLCDFRRENARITRCCISVQNRYRC